MHKCSYCKSNFVSSVLIAVREDGVRFYSSRESVKNEADDIILFGEFPKGAKVIVCPKCQTCHTIKK